MQYYKTYFTNRSFLISLFSSLVLLGISLVTQFYSSMYATYSSSDSVTDIILSNTRTYDVGLIFVYGALFLFLIITLICLIKLNYAPFIIKGLALFIIIRSIFVSLTHIGPFPTHLIISSNFINENLLKGIFTGNDLFFSGHTGLPFLLALMFWDNKKLRFLFLSFSIVFAIVVLLGHIHYSIDVLSAFFITYGIFQISKLLFKKDWKLFLKNEHEAL